MLQYVVKRIIQLAAVLLGVTFLQRAEVLMKLLLCSGVLTAEAEVPPVLISLQTHLSRLKQNYN